MSTTEKQTYTGSCHCGLVSYTLTSSPTLIANICDCSICTRKGYLFVFADPHDVVFDEGHGEDKLISYSFGKKEYVHEFCPVCGSGVLCKVVASGPGAYGINARTINDVDLGELKIGQTFDARLLNGEYEPPKLTIAAPEVQEEGVETLTGSCHCGKVAWIAKTQPLSKQFILEHDCSICRKNAYIVIYPSQNQVAIQGGSDENLTTYMFNQRMVEHKFCKTCGIPVFFQPRPFDENWAEETKAVYRKFLDGKTVLTLRNVNPPLDFESLPVIKSKA